MHNYKRYTGNPFWDQEYITYSQYDFESVMHYQENRYNNYGCGKIFSLNRACTDQTTVIRRPDDGISRSDIAKIQMLYRDEVTPPIPRTFVSGPAVGC